MLGLGSLIRLPFPLFCKFAKAFSSTKIYKKSSTQAGLREIRRSNKSIIIKIRRLNFLAEFTPLRTKNIHNKIKKIFVLFALKKQPSTN